MKDSRGILFWTDDLDTVIEYKTVILLCPPIAIVSMVINTVTLRKYFWFPVVSGIASIFVVNYSSIFPFCQSRKNNGVPTFRTYQKHSLTVNMAVDINKPKIRDNSLDLSKENVGNW